MALFPLIKFQNYRVVTLLLTYLAVLGSQPLIGQQLGFPFTKYIESTEYQAGMQNYDVDQDIRGFIYIANNFGLLEFDGSEWRTYVVKDGSKVRDVEIVDAGKIYVAAQGNFGLFTPNSQGALAFSSLSSLLPDSLKQFDEVWKVVQSKNLMIFCTTNYLFLYKDDEFQSAIRIEPSTLFYSINNVLYLQSEFGKLYYFKNEELNDANDGGIFTDTEVISILPGSENKLLFVCANSKTFNYDGISYSEKMGDKPLLNKTLISTAKRLRNGNIAYGTKSDGLFIYSEEGDLITHLTKGKGLNDRSVLSILEDRIGNLWLGHSNGISIVELSLPFTHIGEELGVQGPGYDAYISNNQLYLATNNHLYKGSIDNNQVSISQVANTEGQNYKIQQIGRTLLLGHHLGAFEVVGGNYGKNLTNSTGYWTFKISPMNPESIIAGSYNGLSLFKLTKDGVKFQANIEGFNESSRVMEFDDFGDLWMTHGYKGVYRITLSEKQDSINNVQFYGTAEGLPSETLVNVYNLNNELIFTTQDGLYKFDYSSNKFVQAAEMTKKTGIRGSLNYLTNDSQGNIYFLAQNQLGTSQITNDGSFYLETDTFNKVYPLINDDLPNISIINSNNILFGAREGFIVYNPRVINTNKYAFKTYIRNVALTSNKDSVLFAGNFWRNDSIRDDQPQGNPVILPYVNNSVQFRFSSNYLNDFEKTTYQHQLVGFDKDWNLWRPSTIQDYTNLPEGDYVFKVRAKNIYNIVSDEASYSFTILPPWYRSKVAFAIYFILFLGSFILVFLLIDRKYNKSKKSFEREKQLELDKIDSELKTVTKEKTIEIERLQSEKLQAEVEYKNAELATSTMNLINKNKFIGHIKGNLTSISKKSKTPEVIKELEKISVEIDKNLSHDDDWKQFAFHFNSVHGDFTTRLTSEFEHLSGQELRLCSYLRLNLSTKEIAELLNISVRGVEIGRYRLRKKLQLERSVNLSEFILNY